MSHMFLLHIGYSLPLITISWVPGDVVIFQCSELPAATLRVEPAHSPCRPEKPLEPPRRCLRATWADRHTTVKAVLPDLLDGCAHLQDHAGLLGNTDARLGNGKYLDEILQCTNRCDEPECPSRPADNNSIFVGRCEQTVASRNEHVGFQQRASGI